MDEGASGDEGKGSVAGGPGSRRRGGSAPGDIGDQRDRKGKFKPNRRPTKKQAMFWTALKSGMTQTDAARAAGYGSPAVAGSITIRSAAVRELADRWMRDQAGKGAEMGLRLAADVLAGRATCTPMQWEIAQFFMKAAGLDRPMAGKDNETKDLNAMSLAELEAMAAKLVPAERVDTLPDGAPDDAQPTENIEESTV